MNRPRQFDIDQLRECITDVFIQHGFNSTSINVLTDARGVGKQSLYNAVGDKQAAYLQALDCARLRNAAVLQSMADAPSGQQAVQRFFDRVIEVCVSDDPAQKRCIVTAGDGALVLTLMDERSPAPPWAIAAHDFAGASHAAASTADALAFFSGV